MPSKLTVMLVSLLLVTPTVIFWLWLVIVPARVAKLCPEECECDSAGYTVRCNGTSFKTFPLNSFTNARFFEIFENNISLIENDSFISLTELELLCVSKCGLRTIELGAFNGLTKLKRLEMLYNEISEILPGTFESLSNLEYLDLFYNQLQHLPSDVFSGLVNLKYIDLSINKLQYLHPDTFLGLPNIKQISFFNNPDLQIPADRPFIKSHSLSHINIALCNVRSLSVETFANVSGLEWLGLMSNSLRAIDINTLRSLTKLSTLYLYGKLLQCDCQLVELSLSLKNLSISVMCEGCGEDYGICSWRELAEETSLKGMIIYLPCNDTVYIYNNTVTQIETETGTVSDKDELRNFANFYKQYQVEIYAFPFTFGTAGNVIVLIIIICNKDMRTARNMYIINLAISDIIFLALLYNEAWQNRISTPFLGSQLMYFIFFFINHLSVGLSAYSIAMLSIQRYRVTVNFFHVHVSSPPTWRFTVATICGVWIVAVLFAVPSAIGWSSYPDSLSSINLPYYKRVYIFDFLVSCVIPLCVIAFSYIKTARHLVESSRPISEGTKHHQLKTRRSSAKIVVGLTVVFVISYLPSYVFTFYRAFMVETTFYSDRVNRPLIFSEYITELNQILVSKMLYVYLIGVWFLMVSPCLNPVALFCSSSQFRKHLKRYLTCFCKTNSNPTDIELARRNEIRNSFL